MAGKEAHSGNGTNRGGSVCLNRFSGLISGVPAVVTKMMEDVYKRQVQGIPLARLSHVLRDLFGLDISEGALVNILDACLLYTSLCAGQ